MRLNKYLAETGLCSRREADRIIEAGLVTVDGRAATLGEDVSDTNHILVRGKEIKRESQKVLLIFNKPKGIVCTAEKREKNNVIDYIDYPIRIFPVGRLDKDSRGLLLLTNEGELANSLIRARNAHEREYEVRVDGDITSDFIERMSRGVYLPELNETTRACKVKKLSKNSFSIVLTQGLNRQIRRMCKECGRKVLDLKRIRIENLTLGNLKEGEYKKITDKERQSLLARMKG